MIFTKRQSGEQQAAGRLELALVVAHLPSPGDMLPLRAEEAARGQKEGRQKRRGTDTFLMRMRGSVHMDYNLMKKKIYHIFND